MVAASKLRVLKNTPQVAACEFQIQIFTVRVVVVVVVPKGLLYVRHTSSMSSPPPDHPLSPAFIWHLSLSRAPNFIQRSFLNFGNFHSGDFEKDHQHVRACTALEADMLYSSFPFAAADESWFNWKSLDLPTRLQLPGGAQKEEDILKTRRRRRKGKEAKFASIRHRVSSCSLYSLIQTLLLSRRFF